MNVLAFFVLAALVVVFAAGDDDMGMPMQLIEDCKKSSGWSGNFRDEAISHERKCFHECLMKKTGIMKSDGSLDKAKALEMAEKMKQKIPADKGAKIMEVTEKCIDEAKPESDSCETAFKVISCYKENGMMH